MNKRIVLGVILCLALGLHSQVLSVSHALAQPTAQARVPIVSNDSGSSYLPRAETYLRSLRSLHAQFTQVGPDGGMLTGQAWLQRPGRMRFQYNAPAPYLLVANGTFVVFHDSQLNQTSNIPLGSTPLGILLDANTSFADVDILDTRKDPAGLHISLARRGHRSDGSITLDFQDNPMQLQGWTVRDAQGKRTKVVLGNIEVGGSFPSNLFNFVDPQFFGNNGGG